jgi:YegS/Rv2252/BmrU family lipid kinase
VVRTTQAPGDAERWATEWGREHPGHPVLAVGGDGTVHEIVNGLLAAGRRNPLGILPAGTGNDVARNTGIPADPAAAIERFSRGTVIPIDAGRLRFRTAEGVDRSRFFINSVSVGVSPRANHIAARIRGFLPGRLRYPISGVVALFAEAAGHYSVTAGGRSLHTGTALNLTLANGASFGGGMRIAPAAVVSDGALDLVVIGALGRIRALVALSRLYAGTHVRMHGVRVTPVRETVQVRRDDGAMLIEADGEEFAGGMELWVDILPGAIHLL